MTGQEHPQHHPETLTEEQAALMLADMNAVIRAGEEMRRLRAEMIRLLAGFGWTQGTIARLTDLSQPAVSKQVMKDKTADPSSPMELSLDQQDPPWLEGRLWGLAEEISARYEGISRCTRYVNAVARGRKHFTPQSVDELRRLVEADLMLLRGELPGSYRDAYDEISRGLDVPAKAVAAPVPASVRRALAHRIQRDRLGGDT